MMNFTPCNRLALFLVSISLLTAPLLAGDAKSAEQNELRTKVGEMFKVERLRPGSMAPDFKLQRVNGETIQASEWWKQKPLVIMTGSFSCPWFRDSTPDRLALIKEFGDHVNFVVVYTVEAHDQEGNSPYSEKKFVPRENLRDSISLKQPVSFQQRYNLAKKCHESLRMLSALAVDNMDNAIWKAYGEAPNCAYLVGTDGKIACQQGMFVGEEMRQSIKQLLAALPSSNSPKD